MSQEPATPVVPETSQLGMTDLRSVLQTVSRYPDGADCGRRD